MRTNARYGFMNSSIGSVTQTRCKRASEASVYDFLFLSTQIINPAPQSPLV